MRILTWLRPRSGQCQASHAARWKTARRRPHHFRPWAEPLEERLTPIAWLGTDGSSWNDPLNWTGQQVPGAGDSVLFSSAGQPNCVVDGFAAVDSMTVDSSWGGTITVPAGASLAVDGGLALSNGTIGGDGAVSLSGDSSWNGGTIDLGSANGSGWSNSGTLTIDTSSLDQVLTGGGTLTNSGTINQFGKNSVVLDYSSILDNTGTYNLQDDGSVAVLFGFQGGTGTLENSGTLEKTGGAHTSAITTTFDNTGGTIDSETGTISLQDPYGAGGTLNGGTLEAGLGGLTTATVAINSAIAVEGNFSGSGSGTVDLAPYYELISVTSAGANFDFPAGLLQWTNGSIDVSSGGTLTNSGVLNLDTTSGSLILNGGGFLHNADTIKETGGNYLTFDRNATLNNTGTFDFTSDASINTAGGGPLVNSGLVEKTGGSTMSQIQSSFDSNGGTLDAATATLRLEPGAGLINGATLEAAANATLSLVGNSAVAYQGTITGTGDGTVALIGGALVVASSGATFDMPGTLFQWTGGWITVDSGGTLTNPVGSVLNIASSGLVLSGPGTLLNNGTINEAGTSYFDLENSATLDNTGTYDFISDSSIADSGGGTLVNTGLIEKTGGSAISRIMTTLDNNQGTIEASVGALVLNSDGGLIDGATLETGSAALIGLSAGATVDCQGTITGSGTGTVVVNGGTVAITGSGATFDMPGAMFQWQAGAIDLSNGSTLTNPSSSVLNINTSYANATLEGSGTLENDGTINETGVNGSSFDIANGATLVNAGTYNTTSFSTLGQPFGGTFSNTGTVNVNGGTTYLSLLVAQVSGTTLTGGTWTVSGNGTLDFTYVQSIQTIGTGARVTLNGSSSTFQNLTQRLNSIQSGGSLSLMGGASYQGPSGQGFTNAGNLTLDAGSSLTASGIFTESATAALTVQIGEVGAVSSIGHIIDQPSGSTSGVALAGTLKVTSTVIPNGVSHFTIVSGGPVSGAFTGKASGSTFTVHVGSQTLVFQIQYTASAVTISPRADTWTGAGTDANWSNPANWGGIVPAVGDTLLFGPGAVRFTSTNNFAPGKAFNAIVFTSSGYTMGGNPIVLEDGIDGSGAGGANVFNVGITLAGSETVLAGGSATTLTLGGAIATGSFTLTLGPGSGAITIVRPISGHGGLTIAAGTVTLAAALANTYTGPTTVQSGTLVLDDTGGAAIPGALIVATTGTSVVRLEASNQIARASTVTIDSLGTLDLNGNSNTLAKLVLSGGAVTTGAGALTTKVVTASGTSSIAGHLALPAPMTITVSAGSTLTVSAALSGSAGLTLAGAGALVLTGNNTYTGATAVAGGTLLVDGTQAGSAITVKSGAMLGGTGSVGKVTIAVGGAMLPGPGAGATGSLTTGIVKFASGSSFDVTLNGTTVGSQYDQLAAGGAISLGGSTLNVTLGFTPAIGTTFTIIQNHSGKAISGTFKGLAEGATFTDDGMTFQISYKGGGEHDVTLTRMA
jgi:autotransporter-associated beta strand protein